MADANSPNSPNLRLYYGAKEGDMAAVNQALRDGATSYSSSMIMAAARGHKAIVELMMPLVAQMYDWPNSYTWAHMNATKFGHQDIADILRRA